MPFTSDGWLQGVQRLVPPSWLVNGWNNPAEGIVCHSMEGYRGGETGRLRQVSWHFSNYYDGSLLQHYPINAQCWHSASWGNDRLLAIEHEGIAGQSLTVAQIETTARVIREVSSLKGWRPSRSVKTLWEHRELSATACPSGRIPWTEILRRLEDVPVPPAPQEEDEEMAMWAMWNEWTPETGVPFRSYLVQATASGFRSFLVQNAEQHHALENSKIAGELVRLPIETLRAFGVSPDPAAQ